MLASAGSPHHRRTQARQRLGQNSSAAADIEEAQARKAVEPLPVAFELPAGRIADVSKAGRVEFVQRGHLAAGVPPLLRQFREFRDLRRDRPSLPERGGCGEFDCMAMIARRPIAR